jgi:chromosome segregation ATPase
MAKQKTLADFPEFVAAEEIKRKIDSEAARVKHRLEAIEAALMAIKDEPPSALAAFQNESNPATVEREGLRREYQELEQRQRFLEKALDEARRELDTARRTASLEICAEERPEFCKEIAEALSLLDQLCAVNDKMAARRARLDAKGVATSSIPVCLIPNLQNMVERYRAWIKADFPEVKI